MSRRPLLISDCDEVLLHMVVPFQEWLDSATSTSILTLRPGILSMRLRHKHDGTLVAREEVWPMLKEFFDGEMHQSRRDRWGGRRDKPAVRSTRTS